MGNEKHFGISHHPRPNAPPEISGQLGLRLSQPHNLSHKPIERHDAITSNFFLGQNFFTIPAKENRTIKHYGTTLEILLRYQARFFFIRHDNTHLIASNFTQVITRSDADGFEKSEITYCHCGNRRRKSTDILSKIVKFPQHISAKDIKFFRVCMPQEKLPIPFVGYRQ